MQVARDTGAEEIWVCGACKYQWIQSTLSFVRDTEGMQLGKSQGALFSRKMYAIVWQQFQALLLRLCKFLVQIHLTRHLKAYLGNYSWFGSIDVDFQKTCETLCCIAKTSIYGVS